MEESNMPDYVRTKDRVNGEPWNSIAKIAGFRWYVNRIENLLLAIYAEHPDVADPSNPAHDLYRKIWGVLGTCEKNLIDIKMQYKPPKPAVPQAGCEMGGCFDDNDCFDDWVCRDGYCRPRQDEGGERAT
jgi:hypothetical protein